MVGLFVQSHALAKARRQQLLVHLHVHPAAGEPERVRMCVQCVVEVPGDSEQVVRVGKRTQMGDPGPGPALVRFDERTCFMGTLL